MIGGLKAPQKQSRNILLTPGVWLQYGSYLIIKEQANKVSSKKLSVISGSYDHAGVQLFSYLMFKEAVTSWLTANPEAWSNQTAVWAGPGYQDLHPPITAVQTAVLHMTSLPQDGSARIRDILGGSRDTSSIFISSHCRELGMSFYWHLQTK